MAQELVTRPHPRTLPEGMTKDELIMALIDHSIGYYSYQGAKMHVEDYLNGATGTYSERGMACYGADMVKEISAAVRWWGMMSPEKKETFRRLAEPLAKLDDDWATSATIGAMWPTMMF
jgi:hypothetical protein